MNRHVHRHHPLAGIGLVVLYVGIVLALAALATVLQNSA